MRRQSIQFRISSAIFFILLVATVVSIYLTTVNQRNNLLDSTQKTLSINTEMLSVSIRNLMLSGEAPIANRTIGDLRKIQDFSEFSLYRADGSTAFNDYSTMEFVNNYQMDILFEETPRIEKRIIDNPFFEDVLRTHTPVVNLDKDKREMEYYFPILNFAECRSCHGDASFVLGVSHFRIPLIGIYGQVRKAGIFLSLFFISVGVILFLWLSTMLRQAIILPVLQIGEVVNTAATGNLDIQVSLSRSDELGELGNQINQMIAGLKERNELQVKNKVIETRFRENRKYLDNINEGLLMLDRQHSITEQYSTYLVGLFEKENLAGLNFSDFLFPDQEKSKEIRKELYQFLEVLFSNSNADMDMIMSINPLDEVMVKINRKKEIILHADFQRIYGEDAVENLMVIFEDRTDLIKTREELEQQKRQRESEVAQIAAILKVGPAVFEGFIKEAWKTFRDLQDNINGLEKKDTIDRLFRDIHSVKGSARYLDYHRIEELTHQIEDMLAEIREKKRSLDSSAQVTISRLLEDLFFQMEGVEALIERFREFSSVQGDTWSGKNPVLTVFEDRISKMVDRLALELGKKVRFKLENPLESIHELQEVQSSLFHILRNALDHGIEDPLERLASGKQNPAHLGLRFRREDEGTLKIEIEDDGRGIDMDRVEALGIEKGLLKPGKHFPSQIIRVLFMPGFSSRDESDSISGRGVGLDAVRDDLRTLGGKIAVVTKKGLGTRFILTLPEHKEEGV